MSASASGKNTTLIDSDAKSKPLKKPTTIIEVLHKGLLTLISPQLIALGIDIQKSLTQSPDMQAGQKKEEPPSRQNTQ